MIVCIETWFSHAEPPFHLMVQTSMPAPPHLDARTCGSIGHTWAIGVSIAMGVPPIAGWFVREDPHLKWMITIGVSPFMETPYKSSHKPTQWFLSKSDMMRYVLCLSLRKWYLQNSKLQPFSGLTSEVGKHAVIFWTQEKATIWTFPTCRVTSKTMTHMIRLLNSEINRSLGEFWWSAPSLLFEPTMQVDGSQLSMQRYHGYPWVSMKKRCLARCSLFSVHNIHNHSSVLGIKNLPPQGTSPLIRQDCGKSGWFNERSRRMTCIAVTSPGSPSGSPPNWHHFTDINCTLKTRAASNLHLWSHILVVIVLKSRTSELPPPKCRTLTMTDPKIDAKVVALPCRSGILDFPRSPSDHHHVMNSSPESARFSSCHIWFMHLWGSHLIHSSCSSPWVSCLRRSCWAVLAKPPYTLEDWTTELQSLYPAQFHRKASWISYYHGSQEEEMLTQSTTI